MNLKGFKELVLNSEEEMSEEKLAKIANHAPVKIISARTFE